MKNFLFIIVIALAFGADSGTTHQVINPEKFDQAAMRKALLAKVNAHRGGIGVNTLRADKALQAAAQDQANYIRNSGKLTHEQPAANKKGPKERINFHGGSVMFYAENIFETMVQRPCSVYNAKGKMVVNTLRTYEETAEAMVNGWKVSKGHKKNMETANFNESGIGVIYDKKTRTVVVVQVFGG